MIQSRFAWLGVSVFSFATLAISSGCAGGDEFAAKDQNGGAAGAPGTAGTAGTAGTGGAASAPDAGKKTTPDGALPSGAHSNGAECSSAGDCASGFCVDGVCCDGACTDGCMSCKIPGKEGSCSPYASGIDPEGDCKDDGAESCERVCDGSGACVSCGDYKCGANACLTACVSDADCKDGRWCDSGACAEKKANGSACSAAGECSSGSCAQGNCCNTSCESPFSCATGECLCNGVVCAAGDSCIKYYEDADHDQHANQDKVVYACSSTPPPGYLTGHQDDCDDTDPDVHPGQKGFFATPRSNGTWDYDCDGAITKEYEDIGTKQCAVCTKPTNGACVSLTYPTAITCTVGFGCSSMPPCNGTGSPYGFKGNVACGQMGTVQMCLDTPGTAACDPQVAQQPNVQGCR